MATKYYVVWEGRKTGIFTDWNTCKKQIDKFAGAKYKSFKTREEAVSAFHSSSAAIMGKTKIKSKKFGGNGLKTYTAEEVHKFPAYTKIFTDGGCEPNPGNAASGIAVYHENNISELWFGLFNPQGTNNTAELNALHQALLMAKKDIERNRSVAIFCDSQYSIQCVTKWAINWEKKGWVKQGGEIKNLEIIKKMFSLYSKIKKSVKILHVNGHVGVEGNELADRMSIHGIDTKEAKFTQYKTTSDLKAILAMRTG